MLETNVKIIYPKGARAKRYSKATLVNCLSEGVLISLLQFPAKKTH